jgi:hypothetical protein
VPGGRHGEVGKPLKEAGVVLRRCGIGSQHDHPAIPSLHLMRRAPPRCATDRLGRPRPHIVGMQEPARWLVERRCLRKLTGGARSRMGTTSRAAYELNPALIQNTPGARETPPDLGNSLAL